MPTDCESDLYQDSSVLTANICGLVPNSSNSEYACTLYSSVKKMLMGYTNTNVLYSHSSFEFKCIVLVTAKAFVSLKKVTRQSSEIKVNSTTQYRQVTGNR